MNYKNKKITIFGCGYIGTPIVKQALEQGMTVTALTRNADKIKELEAMGVHRAIQANLHEHSWHNSIVDDQDYVLNCVSAADRTLEGYRTSYIEGQRSILKWANDVQVGRYIYTSSTGVYPQCHGEVVTEESPTEGASPTGQLLLEAEALLKQDTSSIKHWVILRLAGIYGPGRFYLWDKLKAGELEFETSGEEVINYIHRDDVCRGIWAVFAGDLKGYNACYNLSDGEPMKKKKLVTDLAKKLKIDPVSIKFNATKKVRMNKIVENKNIIRRFGSFIRNNTINEGLYI